MRHRVAAVSLTAVAALLASPLVVPAQAASTASVTTVALTFVPPALSIAQGDGLQLNNADVVPHNLSSVDPSLFRSADVPPGATGEVEGVSELEEGRYDFWCTLHPWMRGVLDVGLPLVRPAG